MYIASFVGDLFDGMAARKFNQSSSFGGLLDMITDRCATLGLLFVLMGEYGAPGFSEYTKTYKLVSEVPSNNCCFDNTKFLCIRFIIFFFFLYFICFMMNRYNGDDSWSVPSKTFILME